MDISSFDTKAHVGTRWIGSAPPLLPFPHSPGLPVSCPVTFDFATAESAAAECRRHASYLDDLATARADVRPTAVEHWRGRFRDDFDREFTSTQTGLTDQAASLRSLAGAIDDAAAAARAEKTLCESQHDHGSGDEDGGG